MTARILDGAGASKLIKEDLADRIAVVRERGVTPCFGSLLIGDDPDAQWSVDIKHKDCAANGISSIRLELPSSASQTEVEAAIDELNADAACTGFLILAPNRPEIADWLLRVDPSKDADGSHPTNLGKLALGEAGPLPCAASGVIELLRHHDIPIAGANVCVIGRGRSAGRPLELLLSQPSQNATVTLCHTGTRDLAAHVRAADIVIAAVGIPGLITAEMVSPGAVVVDVGLSQVEGKNTGDVAEGVYEVAGWASHNPGGVGPMTRVMLLVNIVSAAERL